jgi:hypothetical protein
VLAPPAPPLPPEPTPVPALPVVVDAPGPVDPESPPPVPTPLLPPDPTEPPALLVLDAPLAPVVPGSRDAGVVSEPQSAVIAAHTKAVPTNHRVARMELVASRWPFWATSNGRRSGDS